MDKYKTFNIPIERILKKNINDDVLNSKGSVVLK